MNLPPGGPLSGMAADVRAGLTRPFKELSPRYFYDERGSELFEQITELDEYYPTRCERQILETESQTRPWTSTPSYSVAMASAVSRVISSEMSTGQ